MTNNINDTRATFETVKAQREAARIAREKAREERATKTQVTEDVASLKALLQDARDYGITQDDANEMRGMLEYVIEHTRIAAE